jgi:hypothetical protein
MIKILQLQVVDAEYSLLAQQSFDKGYALAHEEHVITLNDEEQVLHLVGQAYESLKIYN